ncbi:hypothetical protein A0J61_01278 [Choanephora cucurbitarum]|uniref:Uncharacterized protein n=1 Tax=Choanephora cucurbitarum TaxID=101091 RepID=A0A1C7NNM3_9FUNG|nr:hypothetical protein A0J61_01278 [Choanephora cucurbitarum]
MLLISLVYKKGKERQVKDKKEVDDIGSKLFGDVNEEINWPTMLDLVESASEAEEAECCSV